MISIRSKYSIHSPFLYDYIERGLHAPVPRMLLSRLDSYRKDLYANHAYIEVTDLGAGSKTLPARRRQISRIARTAGMSKIKMRLILKTIRYFTPGSALELGSSLGIGSAVLRAGGISRVTGVEGCPETAGQARKYLQKHGFDRIEILTGNFDDLLPGLLQKHRYNIYYIDGNHRYTPTIRYFTMILSRMQNDDICIFDDIHYSDEMEKAWREICAHPGVSLSLDFYHTGMIFIKKELSKEHKCLLFI